METMNAPNPFGAPVYLFGRVASTMDEARRLAAEGCPHGTVAVADEQEAGRGRIAGRSWKAAPGESLLCTTVLRYPSLRETPTAPALRVGVAAAAAVEGAAPFPSASVQVKWPNDVLSVRSGMGKKLCGILCEGDGSALYVGIGINIAQRSFPGELAEKASSIYLETGAAPSRELLLARFLEELRATLAAPEAIWLDRLQERLFRRGERVRFEAGAVDSGLFVEGTLIGVGNGGELLIREAGADTPRPFVTGELKVY